MKNIKTLLMPIMAISFLASCGGGGNKPEAVTFNVEESTVTYDNTNKQAKVYLDWTPSDHSLTFSGFNFTYNEKTIQTVEQTGDTTARPAEVTMTFEEPLISNVTGVLNFHYIDNTAKTEGDEKIEGINILFNVPPVPVIHDGGIDLTYMRANVGKGTEVRFTYTCNETIDNLKVYWGDGVVDNLNYHRYEKAGRYSIYITGNIDNISLTDDQGTMLADGNDNILNIIFSNYVTTIGEKSFNDGKYTSIRSVFIPSTVTNIGSKAIYLDNNGTVYCVDDLRSSGWAADSFVKRDDVSVDPVENINLYLGEDKILYAVYTDDSGNVENNYASVYICCDITIHNLAITNEIEIEGVSYPVTAIWDSAFYEMNTLESVSIPRSVKTINDSVFINCKNLKTVVLNEGLEQINIYAFANTAITEIVIPSTIKEIQQYAFSECYQLKKVEFRGSDPSFELNTYALNNCPNISELILGEGVNKLKQYSIYNMAITNLVLPSTVTSLELYAVNGCESLTTIDASSFVAKENIPSVNRSFVFANNGDKITILMANGLQESDFTSKGWPVSADPTPGTTGFEYITKQ